jgi:hypothetical protein
VVVVDIVAVDECAALVGDEVALLEAERPELDANPTMARLEDSPTLAMRGASKTIEGVATQLPKLFEDRVGLGASGLFEGVGFGGGGEARPGGQALVVDLRQSRGHHERDGVRHGKKFGGGQNIAGSTPAGRRGGWGREGGLQRLVLDVLEGCCDLGGVH